MGSMLISSDSILFSELYTELNHRGYEEHHALGLLIGCAQIRRSGRRRLNAAWYLAVKAGDVPVFLWRNMDGSQALEDDKVVLWTRPKSSVPKGHIDSGQSEMSASKAMVDKNTCIYQAGVAFKCNAAANRHMNAPHKSRKTLGLPLSGHAALVKDILKVEAISGMSRLESGPEGLDELLKERADYLNVPHIGDPRNTAFPTFQLNIVAAADADDASELANSLGTFGGAHVDSGDSAGCVTAMTCLMPPHPDVDEDVFFVQDFGIAIILEELSTVYFCGLHFHGGSQPRYVSGLHKDGTLYIHLTLIAYAPSTFFDTPLSEVFVAVLSKEKVVKIFSEIKDWCSQLPFQHDPSAQATYTTDSEASMELGMSFNHFTQSLLQWNAYAISQFTCHKLPRINRDKMAEEKKHQSGTWVQTGTEYEQDLNTPGDEELLLLYNSDSLSPYPYGNTRVHEHGFRRRDEIVAWGVKAGKSRQTICNVQAPKGAGKMVVAGAKRKSEAVSQEVDAPLAKWSRKAPAPSVESLATSTHRTNTMPTTNGDSHIPIWSLLEDAHLDSTIKQLKLMVVTRVTWEWMDTNVEGAYRSLSRGTRHWLHGVALKGSTFTESSRRNVPSKVNNIENFARVMCLLLAKWFDFPNSLSEYAQVLYVPSIWEVYKNVARAIDPKNRWITTKKVDSWIALLTTTVGHSKYDGVHTKLRGLGMLLSAAVRESTGLDKWDAQLPPNTTIHSALNPFRIIGSKGFSEDAMAQFIDQIERLYPLLDAPSIEPIKPPRSVPTIEQKLYAYLKMVFDNTSKKLPFRDFAASRRTILQPNGPYSPIHLHTWEGFFSALVYRAITHNSEYLIQHQEIVFEGVEDYLRCAKVMRIEQLYPIMGAVPLFKPPVQSDKKTKTTYAYLNTVFQNLDKSFHFAQCNLAELRHAVLAFNGPYSPTNLRMRARYFSTLVYLAITHYFMFLTKAREIMFRDIDHFTQHVSVYQHKPSSYICNPSAYGAWTWMSPESADAFWRATGETNYNNWLLGTHEKTFVELMEMFVDSVAFPTIGPLIGYLLAADYAIARVIPLGRTEEETGKVFSNLWMKMCRQIPEGRRDEMNFFNVFVLERMLCKFFRGTSDENNKGRNYMDIGLEVGASEDMS
ncbi:hypothetical protein DFP72DRAFT_850693 [Ephemerocybe angulata]|uniref:Uncharacterized protein n=1 Tax=Ephemerocybe angulata TaxID=980116 RepID=A0A8H6HRW5_9AGAR|nr:hypothetical protein DFP72DRAFT_850693 [Tulosesus angulatus]